MIVLDTHIWVWWVQGDSRLPETHRQHLVANEADGLGISAISCWEVAKLVELGRLTLPLQVEQWINVALTYPGTRLIDLTPRIAVESTQLPPTIHRDPADQLIIATARVYGAPVMSLDSKVINYPHVLKAP